MPLFFTFSCQFGFHINLKPCHPSFISDTSPKDQLLFCHFCHRFACLCNALDVFPMKHINYSHLPVLTQQENISCHLVIWSKSTRSLLPCLCKKWVEREQNIPRLIPPSVFQTCSFSIQRIHVPSVDSLSVTRDCTATWIAIYYYLEWLCTTCNSKSTSSQQQCVQKFTNRPWYMWLPSKPHRILVCAFSHTLKITNKQYQQNKLCIVIIL